MFATILSMIIIIAVACIVVGMVVVGIQGAGSGRIQEIAKPLAVAGRHLNGEAPPPRGLVAFFEEAESGAEELRAGLRRSGTSARSGVSARTGGTAPSARSAASPVPAPTAQAVRESVAAAASAWDETQLRPWEPTDESFPLSPMDVFVAAGAPARSVWATWEAPETS